MTDFLNLHRRALMTGAALSVGAAPAVAAAVSAKPASPVTVLAQVEDAFTDMMGACPPYAAAIDYGRPDGDNAHTDPLDTAFG